MRKFARGIFIAAALLLAAPLCCSAAAEDRVVFQKNSMYQFISVIEDPAKKERYVINNRRDFIQGGVSLEHPDKLILEYTRMAFVSLLYLGREPRDVLFVGLGAGSMPRFLSRHYPNAQIDVVEIDPDILDVARKYFHFAETQRLKVNINDGRVFLKRNKKKYDMVFLDAYQGGEIPFHLTTVEFMREVKAHLNSDGVVVSNIVAAGKNRFFDSMIVTHEEVFPMLHIYRGRKSANFIFVAASSKHHDLASIPTEAMRLQGAKRMDIDLAGTAARGEEAVEYRVKAKVLTDDFAPVNLYQHMKSP